MNPMPPPTSRGVPPLFLVEDAWLAQRVEEVFEPGLAVIDPHHHLWHRPHSRYLLDELLADLGSGHRVLATVFSECGSMYRKGLPPAFAPVGEVEFVNGIAAMAASGTYGDTLVCHGIVGKADLTLGDDVPKALERLQAAAPERLKGIRQLVAWDASPEVSTLRNPPPPGLLASDAFLAGFAHLDRMGLVFDAGIYHPQMPELIALADRFPQARIVANHLGGWIGVGPYAVDRDETFRRWRVDIQALAQRSNVSMKLGGIGMRSSGFDFLDRALPPTSDELCAAWRPHVETCIEAFGAERCMFESNFPVDKPSFSYRTLWNCFKKLAAAGSEAERHALLAGTADRIYDLGVCHA
jgi:L-fuconolactonase